MVSFEEATKIAKSHKKNVNMANIYEDAYVFYNSRATGNDQEDNDVVVWKEDGTVTNFGDYVMTSNASDKHTKRAL